MGVHASMHGAQHTNLVDYHNSLDLPRAASQSYVRLPYFHNSLLIPKANAISEGVKETDEAESSTLI